MLIVMDAGATPEDIRRVVDTVQGLGLQAHPIPGAQRTAIGITGNRGTVDSGAFENLPGVTQVIPVSAPYKLVSREAKRENTVVSVGGVPVGGERLAFVAGPCAVESEAQAVEIGRRVAEAGATLYRGGAYKPRSSPYSFQGLGEKGLEILARGATETGLPIVTEVLDTEACDTRGRARRLHPDRRAQHAELRSPEDARPARQARAAQARHVGDDRGAAALAPSTCWPRATTQVILCERGIRTFADHTRNTLDLTAIPYVQQISHLPILVDPSHGTGMRDKVLPMARAAVAAGADGLLVEVHHQPEQALSDGPQAILPEMFRELMTEMRRLAPVVGRTV